MQQSDGQSGQHLDGCPLHVTDPEVYYYTSGTQNGLHGTIGTVNGMRNGLHGTIRTENRTQNGLYGTIETENETLNGLHGTIRSENGWNALASILKFSFRKLSEFVSLFYFIYSLLYVLFIYKH